MNKAAAKLQNPMVNARRDQERLVGRDGDPGIVQPQPKASVASMASGVVQVCVREDISGEDNAECGKGEATPHFQGLSTSSTISVKKPSHGQP